MNDDGPIKCRAIDEMISLIPSGESRNGLACDHCGETGRIKGIALKNHLARYFCHDNEKSCYKERRGNYFDEIS